MTAFYSVVYFVRRADGLVKIGCTTALPLRLATLAGQYGPLRLLGLQYGGFGEEHALHRTFKQLRVDGEWFEFLGDLCEYVRELDEECDHLLRLPRHVRSRVQVDVRRYRDPLSPEGSLSPSEAEMAPRWDGRKPIPAEFYGWMNRLHATGMTKADIGRVLGISRPIVSAHLNHPTATA